MIKKSGIKKAARECSYGVRDGDYLAGKFLKLNSKLLYLRYFARLQL